jgi:RHS repeat-associated protein
MGDGQGSTRVVMTSAPVDGQIVVSRHDYLPFGEDSLAVGVGLRTGAQGYSQSDGVRKKYAGMETEDATGMSHTLWREYDNLSARWTAPDPYGGSMTLVSPQNFNRYSYVNNDPVNKVDTTGLMLSDIGVVQKGD